MTSTTSPRRSGTTCVLTSISYHSIMNAVLILDHCDSDRIFQDVRHVSFTNSAEFDKVSPYGVTVDSTQRTFRGTDFMGDTVRTESR